MSKRLFVGSLAYATTDDGLRAHFEAAGFVVKSAQVILDRETGRSRGFAFVELGDESDVGEAIQQLNEQELDGRRLAVREAHDRKSGPRGEGPRRASGPPRHDGLSGGYRDRPGQGDRGPSRPPEDRPEGDRGYGERRHFSKPDAPPAGRRKRKEKRRRDEGGGRRDDFSERRRQKKWRGGGGSSWDDYDD